MKKELLIFGAYGALGYGVSRFLTSKQFEKIYLFGSHMDEKQKITGLNIENIVNNDLAIEENVVSVFKNIRPEKEKVFFLFSTVGGFTGGKTIRETSLDDFTKMLNINLQTNFLLAKHFSSLVKESGGGSICFTAAYTGLHEEAKKGAYGISKSALIHMVKTLAREGAEINLSANAVAPYIIDTPANREWISKGDYSKWIKPEEIGELVWNVFNNFNFISGNIFELKERFLPGK